MRSTGYLGPEHSDLDFVTLLYWLQLAMTHNVLLVYRVDGPLDANVPLTVIGSAIYEDITLMNHSCAANTTRFYQASKILQTRKKWRLRRHFCSLRLPRETSIGIRMAPELLCLEGHEKILNPPLSLQ